MTLRDIIINERGRAGSGGAWRVEKHDGICYLWHYRTLMLKWNASNPSDPDVLDYSIGYGSVSDQGGMNTAFKVLGLPLYFSRNQRSGGPRID